MTSDLFEQIANALPNVECNPHFERTSFKLKNKRIFATIDRKTSCANLKLSEVDQSIFCQINQSVIYPVNNKWGKQGWTTFELAQVDDETMREAVSKAYDEAK